MARQMSATGAQDRPRRLAALVGLVIVGMAFVLGIVIQNQPRDPGPPDDLPRALAFLAAYAAPGLLALLGAFQGRPAILAAAGLLSLAGSMLSAATIAFAVPGVVLILLGLRMRHGRTHSRYELVIAAVVVLLVGGGGVAPLVMAEERCWQATKSSATPPVYTDFITISCSDDGASDEGGQTLATGSEGGVLTTNGGLVEMVLLLGALTLTAVSGRTRTSTGDVPAINQVPPV
jgi:hypothetical protein